MKYFVAYSLKKNRTFFKSEYVGMGNSVIGIDRKMDNVSTIRAVEEHLRNEIGADDVVIINFVPLED
jgi:hypothetical protein